jgi:ribose 5-phosphate isomerase A
VLSELKALGSTNPQLRISPIDLTGPVKTDQSFFIVDAPFPQLQLPEDRAPDKTPADGTGGVWEVDALAKAIKQITGVLEVGLFYGRTGPQAQAAGGVGGQRPIAAYFGMQDGSVSVRKVRS